MKYTFLLLVLFLAIFSLHNCSEDLSAPSTQSYSPLGTWETIAIIPNEEEGTIDTARVSIIFTSVDSDTTFSLGITSMAGAPIYVSDGTVSLSETTLTAIGVNCVFMGIPLSNDDCGIPILISTANLTETTWKIAGTSFATLPLDFLTDKQKTDLLTTTLLFTRVIE